MIVNVGSVVGIIGIGLFIFYVVIKVVIYMMMKLLVIVLVFYIWVNCIFFGVVDIRWWVGNEDKMY